MFDSGKSKLEIKKRAHEARFLLVLIFVEAVFY